MPSHVLRVTPDILKAHIVESCFTDNILKFCLENDWNFISTGNKHQEWQFIRLQIVVNFP